MRILLALIFVLTGTAWAMACEGRLLEGDAFLNAPICVPEDPQRIVVLDPTYSLGMSLELGAPVIGAPMYGMADQDMLEKAKAVGVTDLGAFTEPSLETMITLQPDLIIGSAAMAASAHTMLDQLAPTVLIQTPVWRDYYAGLAQALGRTAKFDALFAQYDDRVGELKSRVGEHTVSVLRITTWDFQVSLEAPRAFAPFLIMQELGIQRSDYEASHNGETLKRPDWEELAQLDGDILLYYVGGGGTSASKADARLEEVKSNPLWQTLPAVKTGNTYRLDPAVWLEFNGMASAHRVLDDLEKYVLGPNDSKT